MQDPPGLLPLRPRPPTPPARPHHPPVGPRAHLGRHRRLPVLLQPHHRPLEAALPARPRRRPAGPDARHPSPPRPRLAGGRGGLGHDADATRLRLLAQPLVLRGGPAAVAAASPRRQPRNRPPPPAPGQPRVAAAPPGPAATGPGPGPDLGRVAGP